MKNFFKAIGGILIASLGVLVFIRQVNINNVIKEIINIPLWKVGAVVVFNFLTFFFRSLRWGIFLPTVEGTIKKGLFPLVTIGFMVNNFLPARIGEVVRIVLLWKRNKFTLVQSAGSLLLERFIDTLTFTSFLIISILFIPSLKKFQFYGFLLMVCFCIVILSFLLYRWKPQIIINIINPFIKILPVKISLQLKKIGKEVLSTLHWIFSLRKVVIVIFLSFLTTFCHALMVFVLGYGTTEIGILVSMFVITFAALGALIPLSPGYVGTLHAVMLSSFSLLGIDSDKGGSITVLYHAISYISVSLMGIYYFLTLKVNLKEIRKENVEDINYK
ncbi:MAG: flippase-like domain-containing protein [Chitinispirillaceae bacterium]|nr:flippase-like domain-containing protein [Chitinispirillaceae bacterium]